MTPLPRPYAAQAQAHSHQRSQDLNTKNCNHTESHHHLDPRARPQRHETMKEGETREDKGQKTADLGITMTVMAEDAHLLKMTERETWETL
jgi:hypothetical protein